MYESIPPIILKPDYSDKPKLTTSKEKKKSRRSILLHTSSSPYKYQTISFDTINSVYNATLPNLKNDDDIQDVIMIFNLLSNGFSVYFCIKVVI